MSKIVILGSINVDLVSFADRFPHPGETINGTGFEIHQGGKGANQAVSAAMANGHVSMIGAVGTDMFGDFLINSMRSSNVRIDNISKFEGTSGIANIWVDNSGENSIILDAGANGKIDIAFVDNMSEIINGASFLLLQLEISPKVVEYAARIAHENNVKVMLDPAPAFELSDELLRYADYITPNEIEISQITDGSNLKERILNLEKHGIRTIVKAGSKGVYIVEDGKIINLKAFKVKAVDTTGAGDCFNGTLAVALSEGENLINACTFAMAASAISVTRKGAGSSFPKRAEIEVFLRDEAR